MTNQISPLKKSKLQFKTFKSLKLLEIYLFKTLELKHLDC